MVTKFIERSVGRLRRCAATPRPRLSLHPRSEST
jgi:hypothetical protein